MSVQSDDSLDFVLVREFNAPKDLVYRAWTDPSMMAKWWGPKEFTNPVCEMDVRVGGTFRIVMRGTDGVEYPFKGEYIEVVEGERLVFTDDCSEHPEEWHDMLNPNRDKDAPKTTPDAVNIILFEECGNGTKVTVRMGFTTQELRDAHVRMGMGEGWMQSFEKLDELLANV